MPPIAQSLIWLGLVGTALVNPPLAGLGLLFGYAFGDKFFALINASHLLHLPLFITEPVLFILFVRAMVISAKEGRLQEWEVHLKSPWLWFYAIGILNILLGLLYIGPVMVLRDAVIVFYGIAFQITLAYVRSRHHIRALYFVVLAGLLLRLICELFHPALGHRSTTFGMYGVFMVLGALCTLPLWGRFKPAGLAVIVLFTGVMTATDIRTVWVGFLLAFLFVAAFQILLKIPWKQQVLSLGAVLCSVILTLIFLKIAVPGQYAVIQKEVGTFSAGKKSPNLMTRVAMWEDAIQEVLPVSHVFFDLFDKKVTNPYYFGSEERPDQKRMEEISRTSTDYTSKDPSATDILTEYEKPSLAEAAETEMLKSSGASVSWRSRLAARIDSNNTLRTLFGVPFGQRFIPERISAIHKVNRYDPHNSIIAIFYRTGIVGLILFLIITGGIFWRAFQALKRTTDLEIKYLLLGVMSCTVYHLGHSLTDVTLENPFRGLPYWILLGLMMVLTHADSSRA